MKKALSIRQPWAWLIANGHKDVENRDWPTRVRGEIAIHAGKTCTRRDYDDAAQFARHLGIAVPPLAQLLRGGIVGLCWITDCVQKSDSPWFFGPYGFVLERATPIKFRPAKGALGFFAVAGMEEEGHEK